MEYIQKHLNVGKSQGDSHKLGEKNPKHTGQ